MDIVIIGSGNVAAVLGRKFRQAGHNIVQIFSRNASAASELAYEFDTESANYKTLINRNADVYIVAVADDAIASVIDELILPGKVIAHTAASVPMEVLKNVSQHYGVFYPLQTLRGETPGLPSIPVFFDGSDAVARQKLEYLAHSISGENVTRAGDDARLKLHIAAVFVSNFTNHLYAMAERYCKLEGLDFAQLLPLIDETAGRLKTNSALSSQTGPAIRHDKETIEKHLALLQAHPAIKNLYILMTESIQQGY